MVVLIVGLVLGWGHRGDLAAWRDGLRGARAAETAPRHQGPQAGRPSPAALKRAQDKEDLISVPSGPRTVVLTADELASLVADGLEPEARRSLDSIAVTLEGDRFTLNARVRTAALGDALGPLTQLLNPYERLQLSGPAHVRSPGHVGWTPDSLMLRTFTVPPGGIAGLIRALTGARDGTIPIVVPATVGALRIRADGVTFVRRSR